MDEVIKILIEDDVKITRMISVFSSIGIDASDYATNNVVVIFNLLGIDYEKYSDEYLKMIEIATKANNLTASKIIEKLKALT